jgi:hypothetical protein
MKLIAAACLVLIACGSRPPPPPAAPAPPNELEPQVILELMTGVAQQLLPGATEETWPAALFLTAALELGELNGDGRYQAAVRALGEAKDWRYGPLALPYLTLFRRDRDRRMGRATFEAFDQLCQADKEPNPELSRREDVPRLITLILASEVIGRPRYRACAGRLFQASLGPVARSSQWMDLAVRRLLETETDPPARARYQGLLTSHTFDPRTDKSNLPSGAPLPLWAAAAGVNRGYLDPRLKETIRQSWLALARGPRPQGLEDAAVFLMAGAEMFRLTLFEGSQARTVTVSNPLAQPRFIETAEIPWPALARALGAAPGDPIVALDGRTGQFLPSQLLDENGDAKAEKLLVSLSLSADESRPLVVRRLARPFRPARPGVRAYGRFVAEGRDDFAWENDRVAFRVYGPALEPRQTSSGIDVWAKRVREPVIDRWYRRTDLHRDQGEGLDFYRVGPSLGCGGLGLWDGKTLDSARNFRRWRLIADGPVRVAFELDYDAWGPAQQRVTTTKRISLDLGQNLSRIETRFAVNGPARPLPVAVGIVRRGEGSLVRDEPTTWLSYVEPPQGQSGQIGCGVLGPETVRFVESPQHYLLVRDHPSDRPFVYYAGAYWSKGPDFRQPDEWGVYLAAFSRRAGAPIAVKLD